MPIMRLSDSPVKFYEPTKGLRRRVIRFTLGDWSGDGHEDTYPILAISFHDCNEISKAYWTAISNTGFNLHNEVCSDYEERWIEPDDLARLKELGWIPPEDFDERENRLTYDILFNMFVFMVRLGNSDITIEPINEEEEFFGSRSNDEDYPRYFNLGYGLG